MLVVKPENVGLQIVDSFDLTYASRPRFSLLSCVRKSVQFLFSQVGLCALVVLYAFVGGTVFQHLEQTNEIHECQTRANRYHGLENKTLEQLWAIADHLRARDDALRAFKDQLDIFQSSLFREVGGSVSSNCLERESKGDWTFPDAMLFSVTVFTTIGYGNVAPRTFWGRLVCICYSMLGIPLMLLCLGNLASVLGNAFRYVYSQMLCCGCCLPRRLSSKGTRRRPTAAGGGISDMCSNPLTPEQWMKSYEKGRATTDDQSLKQRSDGGLIAEDGERQTGTDHLEKKGEDVKTDIAEQDKEKKLERNEREENAIDSKSNVPPNEWTDGGTNVRKADGLGADGSNGSGTDGRGTTGRKSDGWTDGRTDVAKTGGKSIGGKSSDDVEEVDSEADDEKVGIPLTISLGIIGGYLLFGAVLYGVWEAEWSALDSVYYCFVTISTIGFGDLVPGSAGFQTDGDGWRMISASLYMLVGMALLSMCFNLMQDEIAAKCRRLGQAIGIIDTK